MSAPVSRKCKTLQCTTCAALKSPLPPLLTSYDTQERRSSRERFPRLGMSRHRNRFLLPLMEGNSCPWAVSLYALTDPGTSMSRVQFNVTSSIYVLKLTSAMAPHH